MTATLSSRSDLAPLFERRLPRLAKDLLDDFERETDLPFLPFASTRAEKGQATKIMKRAAVNSVRCLGECNDIVFFSGRRFAVPPLGGSVGQKSIPLRQTLPPKGETANYGLLSEIKMRG